MIALFVNFISSYSFFLWATLLLFYYCFYLFFFVRLIFYCHIDSSEPNVRSTVKLPSKRRDRGGARYELPSFNLRDLHRICWKKIIAGWINLVAEFKAVWETDGTLSSSTVCITQYGIFEFSPLKNLSELI